MTELSERDCWELLAKARYGRLAYHLAGEVHIVPVNYLTETAQRRLLFRTTEGNKLLGVAMNGDVAFEIDDVVGDVAWSVVVRGQATVLEGHDIRAVDDLPLTSWVSGAKHRAVAVDISEITGRRFALHRPEPQH